MTVVAAYRKEAPWPLKGPVLFYGLRARGPGPVETLLHKKQMSKEIEALGKPIDARLI